MKTWPEVISENKKKKKLSFEFFGYTHIVVKGEIITALDNFDRLSVFIMVM